MRATGPHWTAATSCCGRPRRTGRTVGSISTVGAVRHGWRTWPVANCPLPKGHYLRIEGIDYKRFESMEEVTAYIKAKMPDSKPKVMQFNAWHRRVSS